MDHIAHMGADFVHLLFDAGGELHVPNLDQCFGKSEQTDHCLVIADAGHQVGNAEGKPLHPVGRVHADGSDEKAKGSAENIFDE